MIAQKSFIYIAVLALLTTAGLLVINATSVDAWGSDSGYSRTRIERESRSSKKESNRSHERITYEVREDDRSRDKKEREKRERDDEHKDYKKHEGRIKEREHHYKDDDVEVSVRGTGYVHVSHSDSCCNCCNDSSHDDCRGSGGHDDGDVLGDNDDKDDPKDEDPKTDDVLELRVDTKVKVNGGDYEDAETEETAPVGEIGDTATWKVTVEADEMEVGEDRDVRIHWQPPANVKPISHEVTSGAYDGSVWEVNIGDMPAMLTAETQIIESGHGASDAVIAEISCDTDPSGFCPFEDYVLSNNMNPAGVVALAAEEDPADPGDVGVLGASTGGQGGDVLGATTRGGQVLGESAALAATGISTYVVTLIGVIVALAPLTLLLLRQRT